MSENDTAKTPAKYSDGERNTIFALGRFFLEIADIARAEIVFRGLVEIDPKFTPGRLGLSYVFANSSRWEEVESQARYILDHEPKNPEALLFGVLSALNLGERTTGGSRLGEFGELIDSGLELDADQLLIYRSQLARYQDA